MEIPNGLREKMLIALGAGLVVSSSAAVAEEGKSNSSRLVQAASSQPAKSPIANPPNANSANSTQNANGKNPSASSVIKTEVNLGANQIDRIGRVAPARTLKQGQSHYFQYNIDLNSTGNVKSKGTVLLPACTGLQPAATSSATTQGGSLVHPPGTNVVSTPLTPAALPKDPCYGCGRG